jgi:ankyrin repeat protein
MVSAGGASISFSDLLFIVVLLLFLAPYIQGAVKYATGINLAAAAAALGAASPPGASSPPLLAAADLAALLARRVRLDEVMGYVALRGWTRDGAHAFAATRDQWRNDVQMQWGLAKARHGERRMTRLMWACREGRLPRVRELIAWTSDVNAVDARGWAPLHFACAEGHLEVARELLARGAKIEAKDKSGDTALHIASFHSHLEVVHLLIERGAVVDVHANDGCTSLMIASEYGHAAVVRELLARGADVNARNNDGRTALHAASFNGHAEAMRELLKRHNVGVNAQSGNGSTPLIAACLQGHLMAATILIAAGADLALVNNAGRSALFYAEQRVQQDALAPPGAADPPPVKAQREHKALVALLRVCGAI